LFARSKTAISLFATGINQFYICISKNKKYIW